MRLGLAFLRKHLTGGYRQVFALDGFTLCIWRGTECFLAVASF